MLRIWSVAVARDPLQNAAWRRVGTVMRSWSVDATVTPIGEIMWMADTGSAAVADALVQALVAVGAQPLCSSRTTYEDEDYAAADLIGVFGVGLSLDPPFVRNAAKDYRVDPPCPQYGHQDMFDVTVTGPPRIDEAMLDAPAPDGSHPGPLGWEAVCLPDGGLLLSTRLVTELRRRGIGGLSTDEVLDARGATSARMVALRAPVAVLAPCPRHGRVEGTPFCPACGAGVVVSTLDGYFWMPRSVIGNAEIVSKHRHRAATLHVSPRAYEILGEVPGISRGNPVRVCED